MKHSCTRSVTFILLGLLLFALAIYPAATASGQDPGVKDARERVQEAGSYRFLSSIAQTLVPRPIPEVIGVQKQGLNLITRGAVQLPDPAYLEMWAERGATQAPPMG